MLYLLPRLLSYLGGFLEAGVPIEGDVRIEADMARVIDEALKYPKIHESEKPIDREILATLLEVSQ